jgi:putative ABC transport system permease protein
LTVDSSLLWVGAALAIVAAVILAFVPRLPSADGSSGVSLVSGSVRMTSGSSRRQRVFAVTQIAASFVLLAGACTLVTTLIALQAAQTGLDTRHVLVIDVPTMSSGKTNQQVIDFYKEVIRRVDSLSGVSSAAFAIVAPWRDGDNFGIGFQFSADGHPHGNDDPHAMIRTVSPGFFAALGVPILAGRDFNSLDDEKREPVAIVSATLANRMFPNGDAIGRHVYWTDPVLQFLDGTDQEKARFVSPRRIIGVAADIDDLHVVPEPTPTIYATFADGPLFLGHLFIHTYANPDSLIVPVTHIIREMSADQPVEHPATLADIRAKVLAPDRLNSIVFGVFAGVALLIAVVGIAGVLAFSVSSRTREFGIRLALGSQPENILRSVVTEGAVMAGIGVLTGAAIGLAMARLASSYFADLKMPGALPVIVSALVLLAAAVVASTLPAMRAARVDVIQALRSE